MTTRDRFEEIIVKEFNPQIRPFDPKDYKTINKYKNGSFGVSSMAFGLYSNGHNFRGVSTNYKFGFIYEDGSSLFSISFFKQKNEDDKGFVFIVAPTGNEVLEKVDIFVDRLQQICSDLVSGVYVRYLNFEDYLTLLNKGYIPAKEYPFFPEAPEEDESLSNALVEIDKLIEDDDGHLKIKNIEGLSKTSKKKARMEYFRFRNFLERKGLRFSLDEMKVVDIPVARTLIEKHFLMLAELGKNVGSTPEDHLNAFSEDLLVNPDTLSFMGKLQAKSVTVYIGEGVSSETFALYTSFTLRDLDEYKVELGLDSDEDIRGITAMSRFCYIELLFQLKKKGFKYINLGGSELSDLNKSKRRFGATTVATYWALKKFSN